ncbi:L-2-hydroxyglutarate oxidase [Hydrogenivirga sp. 128-5-R1-1]|uniref:L-2-hydroxyglutarate oxidase n=1 Tax=Hydrogenivirga sp. 128-5-R1-1 TaxID=392423 RepID=UPI00015EF776|nr:L-2-hydroxyglutarate oxidase [Hydrogenivirga sp. 128-5-R1-1]EDP75572.1 FAD-dependent oxidoreductase [Hydrogenivirga sp. 128-5-R1-1]
MQEYNFDYVIIGAGIIGLTLAKNVKEKYPKSSIAIIEKEPNVGFHSSGRNSGVLHAGFYYTADSLKAKFTKEGCLYWRNYCKQNNLKINECGKVVVCKDEEELETLFELKKRGDTNEVPLEVIDENELKEYEPNAKTYQKALWSPLTATIDPKEILTHLKNKLKEEGVNFFFKTPYKYKLDNNTIVAGNYKFYYKKLINCAGLYSDEIAKDFGFSENYIIIPFKGIYIEYSGNGKPIKTNIYPVPNIKNPFLGVHYTIKVDGTIKIGPTAIPAFWRENYKGLEKFKLDEFLQIITWESILFLTNSFGFRSLALEEMRKYNKNYLIEQALQLVKNIDKTKFSKWGEPGIRAQLLNTKTRKLEMDFIVEGDKTTVHILNAVSPAFTASYPFTKWIVENYL